MSVWDNLVGQDHTVRILQQVAAATHSGASGMTHAWLFTGPPGSGRSNVARAFAAALQCENQAAPGCGQCAECRNIMTGSHRDLTAMATDRVIINIEEVSELVRLSALAPSQGRWRIILVEDADRIQVRTFNVLLKSLEEPPDNTVWMLCAPSAEDVPITVRSRCRLVNLAIPPATAVAELLAAQENIPYETALAAARQAQSHIGVARRLVRTPEEWEHRLDMMRRPTRVRSVADAVLAAAELSDMADAAAQNTTAETNAQELAELLQALGAEEKKTLDAHTRAQVRQLEEDQKRRATRVKRDTLDQVLIDLLALYRDVYLRQVNAAVPPVYERLQDLVADIATQSTPAQTMYRIDALQQTRARLAANANPLLALESLMVQLRPHAGR